MKYKFYNDKFESCRAARSLTYEEIGKRLNVSRQAVMLWGIAPNKPRPKKVYKLAEALNVDVKEISDLLDVEFNRESKKIERDINAKENLYASVCKRLGISTDRPVVIYKDIVENDGEMKVKSDILSDNEITLLEKFRKLSPDKQIEILVSIKDKGVTAENPTASRLPKAANH